MKMDVFALDPYPTWASRRSLQNLLDASLAHLVNDRDVGGRYAYTHRLRLRILPKREQQSSAKRLPRYRANNWRNVVSFQRLARCLPMPGLHAHIEHNGICLAR